MGIANFSRELSAATVALVICFVAAAGPAWASGLPAGACQSLQSADFSAIVDAPTQVMESVEVDAVEEVPRHCHAQGYISPQVGFELKLPTSEWNGKLVQIGCGGLCGSTRFDFLVAWCEDALRRGYACIVSDRGHASSRSGRGNAAIDGLWAFNNLQAQLDYGLRAAHVTALAGKAIAQRYFGIAPSRSYFMGCSGGGRQGLMEAQRFPWDFDGIIAVDPGPDLIAVHMTAQWNARVTRAADGGRLLQRADLELLHEAVLAKCDAEDGLKDRIIGDPRACAFDPGELVCRGNQRSGCLTPLQVAAVRQVYSGPTTSNGEQLFFGAPPGAELSAAFRGSDLSTEFMRYLAFMLAVGPAWKPENFDFDVDFKRFGTMAALYEANNPDLRRFKHRGGKLLMVQSWVGTGSPLPFSTVDYYETMERTLGGRHLTQQFARLFMMPGMDHCYGGRGANTVDYLGYLESWVEQGQAPDLIVTAHIDSENVADYVRWPKDQRMVKFTRAAYPHPLRASYRGAGDPNDYKNFLPVH